MLVCDRKSLIDEIDRVYKKHYEGTDNQAVHDFYNAVIRRIRRFTLKDRPEIIAARLRRNDCDYREWILSCLIDFHGTTFQLMIRLPKEIYDSKCTNVEVKR